ncbi:DUF1566 domain-containing protein [bacterium]|nr:DUF1566 domain-containing protein [bacterium]
MKNVLVFFCLLVFSFQLFASQWYSNSSRATMEYSSRSAQKMEGEDAVNYCRNLNEGGHNDWALPNSDQARELIMNANVERDGLFSSDTVWYVHPDTGMVYGIIGWFGRHYVRCVRKPSFLEKLGF